MIAFSGKAILLDIEGTTSSVHFVYRVLFPFARQQLSSFLAEHWDEMEVRRACEMIAKDAGGSFLGELPVSFRLRLPLLLLERKVKGEEVIRDYPDVARQLVVAEANTLMDADVKATGLKELQGLIWKEGYRTGKLCSHVYDDVPPALNAWHNVGLDIRIYSSGSNTAQKQFFAHTDHGDLTGFFRGHYDTTTGPKKEPASYAAIAKDMNLPPAQILFCSDVVAELDAARAAGMQTALVVRQGNAPAPEGHGHPFVDSLDQIRIN